MDTWAFHYAKSKIDYLARNWKWFLKWAGPKSWMNKNNFKNPFIRKIMRTVLSFVTDLWHNTQFWMFTALQILIAWNVPNVLAIREIVDMPHWGNVVIWVLIQKMLFGGSFEAGFNWLKNGKPKEGSGESLSISALAIDRGGDDYLCENCGDQMTPGEFGRNGGWCRPCIMNEISQNHQS